MKFYIWSELTDRFLEHTFDDFYNAEHYLSLMGATNGVKFHIIPMGWL